MIPYELTAIFAQLQAPATRAEGMRALAALAGTHEVLLFGRDDEVGQFLPAPGLPQTLRDGYLWLGFLQECARDGAAQASMPDPSHGADTPAFGITDAHGQAIMVFLAAPPARALEAPIRALLPLLGGKLASERTLLAAQGQLAAARDSLRNAHALAAALEAGRRALQGAHDAAQRELADLRRRLP